MSDLNKAQLIGRLGQDPSIRYTHDNECVASFSMATSDNWNDHVTGEKKQRTEWHNVVFFGKIAEVVEKWLTKGSQVYVEGKLKTEKYQDKNGVEKYTTKIHGMSLQMLGSKNEDGTDAENGSKSPGERAQGYKAGKEGDDSGSEPDFDDDVPF